MTIQPGTAERSQRFGESLKRIHKSVVSAGVREAILVRICTSKSDNVLQGKVSIGSMIGNTHMNLAARVMCDFDRTPWTCEPANTGRPTVDGRVCVKRGRATERGWIDDRFKVRFTK